MSVVIDDNKCSLCGHNCLVRRGQGERGICGLGPHLDISASLLHYGEEPPISGYDQALGGSGTIFFTGCVLRCPFCQNWQISQSTGQSEVEIDRAAEIMLGLQEQGAFNINLVSPTPFVRPLVEALTLAKSRGLAIPVVYNTGGYDSLCALALLDGLVDIYLPDIKIAGDQSASRAQRILGAANYAAVNRAALKEMFRQVGHLRFDERGLATGGLLVRHLVLPGDLAQSAEVLPWLAETFGGGLYLSLMAQYSPAYLLAQAPENFGDLPELTRGLTAVEYSQAVDIAWECGLENTFVQELSAAENYLPDFDEDVIFR